MMVSLQAALGAIAFLASVLPGLAGPCSDEIALIESRLDAKIEAIIDTARFAREARSQFGLPPPKGGSLVTAGRRDVDASWLGEAVVAIAQARQADRAGETLPCEEAVAAARRAISR